MENVALNANLATFSKRCAAEGHDIISFSMVHLKVTINN